MSSPPSRLALLLKHPNIAEYDLSSLKIYVCSGQHITDDLINRVYKHTRISADSIYNCYGMTEMAGALTWNARQKPGSVGRLLPGIQAKIIDDHGNQCGVHEIGVIHLKTLNEFIGYLGLDEKLNDTFDKDGWLITGDAGYFDDDGYLYLIDRRKDILKFGGCQVSPSEIEEVLAHHSAIEEACVVGIPNAEWGELIAALIVTNGQPLTEGDVQQYVKGISRM